MKIQKYTAASAYAIASLYSLQAFAAPSQAPYVVTANASVSEVVAPAAEISVAPAAETKTPAVKKKKHKQKHKKKHKKSGTGSAAAATSTPVAGSAAATPAPKSELATGLDKISTSVFPSVTPGSFGYALLHGTPTVDARYRYEHVDQKPFTRDADASTLRTRLGYMTGQFYGFDGHFEWQNIHEIGAEHYNGNVNSLTRFPLVPDPQSNRLNQLTLGYHDKDVTKTDVVLGRQVINLDNQRFVGEVDWRQSNQVFDAISFTNTLFEHAKLFYAYINQVHRVFTDRAVPGDTNLGTYHSDSHLINGSYDFAPALKVTAYSYLLDFSNAPASSDATYGSRATGSYPLCQAVTLSYAAEAAHQTDYGHNTANISENYYLIEPAVSAYGFTLKPGYEVLEGNGTTAFQTPLATYHMHDGWADKFLTTPANGLENSYVNLTYKVPFGEDYMLKGTQITAIYHDWDVNHGTSAKYGTEWDWLISQTFYNHYELALEAADYKADRLNATTRDTKKVFAWLRIKY